MTSKSTKNPLVLLSLFSMLFYLSNTNVMIAPSFSNLIIILGFVRNHRLFKRDSRRRSCCNGLQVHQAGQLQLRRPQRRQRPLLGRGRASALVERKSGSLTQ
jgi:hypothetical protein